MADAIRCLLVIYSQNHVANASDGDGLPTILEKKTSPIVKLTLVPCSKGGTCGVIHSIKGTLYGCVY